MGDMCGYSARLGSELERLAEQGRYLLSVNNEVERTTMDALCSRMREIILAMLRRSETHISFTISREKNFAGGSGEVVALRSSRVGDSIIARQVTGNGHSDGNDALLHFYDMALTDPEGTKRYLAKKTLVSWIITPVVAQRYTLLSVDIAASMAVPACMGCLRLEAQLDETLRRDATATRRE